MQLIDTHCHIDVEAFSPDRESVLERCRQLGVERLIVPAITADAWGHLLELCRRHPGLYPALGLHPMYQASHRDEDLKRLEAEVERERPLAIGEIGLDFFIPEADREAQTRYFEAQLRIAQKYDLPVVVHARKSHDAILQSLRKVPVRGGTCHAFNGSEQQAGKYIELGFKLGFGGMLTYQRSSKLRRLARDLPLEALVLETDAPDMTVASHHGERNSPEYLPECLDALAEVRQQPRSLIAEATWRNAIELFDLPD